MQITLHRIYSQVTYSIHYDNNLCLVRSLKYNSHFKRNAYKSLIDLPINNWKSMDSYQEIISSLTKYINYCECWFPLFYFIFKKLFFFFFLQNHALLLLKILFHRLFFWRVEKSVQLIKLRKRDVEMATVVGWVGLGWVRLGWVL